MAEGDGMDQLEYWNQRGMFSRTLSSNEISSLPRHPSLRDDSVDEATRVRAYLDVNCGNCHQPGSGVHANLDLRSATPLRNTNLISGAVLKNFGAPSSKAVQFGSLENSVLYRRFTSQDPGEIMPPIGHLRVDPDFRQLLAKWIVYGHEPPRPIAETPLASDYSKLDELILNLRQRDLRTQYFGVPPNRVWNDFNGLRITMPRNSQEYPSAGLRIPVYLSGDFLLTADFRFLDVPRPNGGYGAGVSLVIKTSNTGKWASLHVVNSPHDGQLCVAHMAGLDETGKQQHSVYTALASQSHGRLRIVRIQKTLHYQVSEGDSNKFHEIRAGEFTDGEVREIELAAQNGEHPSQVEIRWERLSLSADQAEMPRRSPSLAPAPAGTTYRPFALLACLAITIAISMSLIVAITRGRHMDALQTAKSDSQSGVHPPS